MRAWKIGYNTYLDKVFVKWNEIWWVTNTLDELVNDGVLPKEEAQNLLDSLYYGEKWKDFLEDDGEKWKDFT